MNILLAFRHRKALVPYVDLAERLRDRGHAVTIGVHQRDDRLGELFGRRDGLTLVTLPDRRRDEWNETAELGRHVRDVVQYLRDPYRDAGKLRRRVFERLLKLLQVPGDVDSRWSADALLDMGAGPVEYLDRVLRHLESQVPPDHVTLETLSRVSPDLVLISPLLHFGSTQVELVKAARALGTPVGMLLFSWDNLSTKGALHARPDHLFVWNERQREEAEMLHGFPGDRVTITGAPRFDRFFGLSSRISRAAFCAPLGVPPETAIVLYLCSSRLVSEKEVNFLRQWVRAVRASPSARLRNALLVVRPHPDLPLAEGKWMSDERTFRWAGFDAEPRTRVLFGDARALVLASDFCGDQLLYESIFHAAAVVGLNTSAEIEAAIVGRPVFTVLTGPEHADGQHSTLHFHYLTEPQGGFVQVAATLAEHAIQVGRELEQPAPPEKWRSHVAAFVRPLGWSRPACEVLVEAVETVFDGARSTAPPGAGVSPVRRVTSDVTERGLGKIERVRSGGVVAVDAGCGLWAIAEGDDPVGLSAPSRAALEWLQARVGPGSIVYDVNAGDGLFAIAAARRFGCTVMAFEGNLVACGRLWQNALLNGCDGLVVPLCLRAAARSTLAQERYDRLSSQAMRLPIHLSRWREHASPQGVEVIQPVLGVPLDWAMKRWKLPPPQAMRVSLGAAGDDTLAGIEGMLTECDVAALILEGSPAAVKAAVSRLSGATRLHPCPVPGAGDEMIALTRRVDQS